MVRRSTWIIVSIFVVLLVGALLLARVQKEEVEEEPTPTLQVIESLFDIDNLVVVQIDFASADGEAVTFQRDTVVGEWSLAGAEPGTTDVFAAGGIAGELFALQIQTRLDNIPSLGAMGLVSPAYTISMTKDNGEKIVLYVGDLTPTGTGYYIQVDKDDPVVVSKVNLDSILGVFETPPLLPTPTLEATLTPEVSLTPEAAETGTNTEETPPAQETAEPTQ
ncbi:MAG: DUF4340 domain-containing protein [Anaerolineales bacterium]|nr:DUF4340 domain-containing protein [Anaerolineales bacterium]